MVSFLVVRFARPIDAIPGHNIFAVTNGKETSRIDA